jgi:hypothetical protein
MCVFKALHVNPNDQHSELQEAEFYDFYEVQNLKWREVKVNHHPHEVDRSPLRNIEMHR